MFGKKKSTKQSEKDLEQKSKSSIIKCENGHFYNAAEYSESPHCKPYPFNKQNDIQDNELSDNVIEAFIEKIFVTKDEFRWYLRSNKETSNIEPIQVASFTLTQEDGKNYLYSFSTRRRVFNWKDLNVTVWA